MGRISFGDNVLWWCKIYTRNNKNEDELRERDALNIRFDVFVRNSPEYNTIASSTIEFYGYVWNEIIFYYRIYVRKQDQRLTRTPIICNVHVTFDANVYVHIPFDEQQKLCSYSNTIGTCGLFCILDEFRFFFCSNLFNWYSKWWTQMFEIYLVNWANSILRYDGWRWESEMRN